jgi:hypothetical protein
VSGGAPPPASGPIGRVILLPNPIPDKIAQMCFAFAKGMQEVALPLALLMMRLSLT